MDLNSHVAVTIRAERCPEIVGVHTQEKKGGEERKGKEERKEEEKERKRRKERIQLFYSYQITVLFISDHCSIHIRSL